MRINIIRIFIYFSFHFFVCHYRLNSMWKYFYGPFGEKWKKKLRFIHLYEIFLCLPYSDTLNSATVDDTTMRRTDPNERTTTTKLFGWTTNKKKQQQYNRLHAKYVAGILREATIRLKRLPNLNQASTAISKQVTICGDLHGKLDDLLVVFHKVCTKIWKKKFLSIFLFISLGCFF